MSFIANLAAKSGLVERRRDGRASPNELTASYWSGLEEKRARIKDISPTGAYLLTNHRWSVGTKLTLTLQNRSRKYKDSSSQVRLVGEVVRLDNDGVGVSFVQKGNGAEQWSILVATAISLTSEAGVVRVFQMANALGFLLRISPAAKDGIVSFFKEKLSEDRIDRALEVVLRAEALVSSENLEQKSTLRPILQIVRAGSKSDEGPVLQWWAGLLAAATLDWPPDEILSFAALLSKLESVDVLLLAAAGQKSVQAGTELKTSTPQNFVCKMDEIKRVTRTKNIVMIECALNRLHELGLLELTVRPFGCAPLDSANLTPTKLGLAFYHACAGRQVSSEAADDAEANLMFPRNGSLSF